MHVASWTDCCDDERELSEDCGDVHDESRDPGTTPNVEGGTQVTWVYAPPPTQSQTSAPLMVVPGTE